MLQDFETWSKYESITLVYSVRTASELAYATRIQEIAETFGEGHTGFKFVPIITRDPHAPLHDRLPVLIENGELEKAVGLSLNPETSHVMLCGNPQMVEDTKEALKARGLTMNRRGEGKYRGRKLLVKAISLNKRAHRMMGFFFTQNLNDSKFKLGSKRVSTACNALRSAL